MPSTHLLVILGSIFVLGLRHGVDHDHIAAITDLTALQPRAWRAMRLGIVYAAGHGLVLFALGAAAVMLGLRMPDGWDVWREKIVGATLVALGVSVIAAMIARRGTERAGHIPTRAGFVLAGLERLNGWIRRTLNLPARTSAARGETPAFTMGVLHGLSAETPSQLLLLVVAAGMGTAAGLSCVAAFVLGLFITNTVLCAAFIGIYRHRESRRTVSLVLSGLSAVYSVLVGVFYLLGEGIRLPVIG